VLTQRRLLQGAVVATALLVTAAACGSSKKSSSSSGTTAAAPTTAAAAATTAGGSATTASGGSATTAASSSGGGGTATASTWCSKPLDTSIDKDAGTGAGFTQWVMQCAADKPLKASGDALTIGVQNSEGDPAGTFPEYSKAIQAATDYINNELGGYGADYVNGKPGRPLKIELCTMAINPADSTKCANDLASKKPFFVVSTLNFFGNQFPIYKAANVPVLVGTPITIADFTSDGVFAIGNGGGCLGVHTGLVEFVTKNLGAKKVGVPWADTPPGVTCYNDLEKKPLNILGGKTQGPADAYNKYPGLTSIGVPIKPAQPDITPQAQQVLDFKPDAIIFSAQGADCWSLVSTLSKLGWSTDKIPLVLSTSCLDTQAAKAAGDSAKGIYFVGSPPAVQPDMLSGIQQLEAQIYNAKMKQYGAGDQADKGFATSGFNHMMLAWLVSQMAAGATPDGKTPADVTKLTQDNFVSTLKATANDHAFGGTVFGCSGADSTYKSTCATAVSAFQWDGSKYVMKVPNFSGVYIIKGTPIDTGS
jgi:branched-chain amino acid transport system substrate-binding protein